MISLVACTALLLYGAVQAMAAGPTPANPTPPSTQGSTAMIQSSILVGTTVLDPRSQKLGQIKDVVFDTQTGQASFVLLDADIPGSGHAMLVVPYPALRVSFNAPDHRQSVVLDLRPDQLRSAPQIQNSQWQMLQNPQFLAQARDFYQIKTYTAARPIDQPSTGASTAAAPVTAPPTVIYPPPVQYFVAPPPCLPYYGSPWTQELDDFSEE